MIVEVLHVIGSPWRRLASNAISRCDLMFNIRESLGLAAAGPHEPSKLR